MAHDCHQGSHDNSVAFFKLCDSLMVIFQFFRVVFDCAFQSVHGLFSQPLLLSGVFDCAHDGIVYPDQEKNDRHSTDKLLE